MIRFDDELVAELFDAQPQPVFWMRPIWDDVKDVIIDFEYAYCNQEIYAYTGLTKEQLIGNRLSTSFAVNEELRKHIFPQLKDVYLTGKKVQDIIFNPVLNKYYSFIRSKVADGVLTIIQDRGKEYDMIQELERQQSLIQNILKHSSSGISVTEVIRDTTGKVVDGKTIMANDAAEQFLLIPKEEYLSKTVREIDPNIFDSPIYQMALLTLETGKPFHTQYFFEPAQKWIELSVSKMDADHLINIFTDVTVTKTAQLELESAAERLRSVFNASQSGMFTFAPEFNGEGEVVDFRFVITNPQFAAYVGQTPEVLNGALGSTWFPGYLHNGVFDMYKHTYLTGETQRKDVHYFVDGHDLYLDLMSTKVGNEVLITFNDYSSLKNAQLQLEKSVEDLKRSNANLEEFAYAASHDLKEPIRKIHFFSDRLKTQHASSLNDEGIKILDRLQVATERMRLLVDTLLEYSHVSVRPHETEDVDLNKKLRLVCEDLELSIEEKKAVIKIDPLPVVKGHRRQLQQLFHNLIGNALKYSKSDAAPIIEVSHRIVKGSDMPVTLSAADVSKDFHLIEVTDNGIGFDQQDADRIFNVFQRLHGNAEYKGTGIGLSIARKV
ncbi:MAG TPA: ATP-binding protein, partial [Flavisolibacter sp.]|nr:ATP-binding protein [Flavisolibacter sp.]